MDVPILFFRELLKEDYDSYMDLMYEFTNYKYNTTKDQFYENYINKINNYKIIVLFSKIENKIIGAGTIIKIEKLHNNPIGQIEDVIITNKYRKFGFGKYIINHLTKIGIEHFNCYKVILNCLEHNVGFYEKCGFKQAGFELKYLPDNNILDGISIENENVAVTE